MRKQHVIPSPATEAKTVSEIQREFRKWNHDAQEEGEIISAYDFPVPKEIGSRAAVCRFVLRGQSIVVECASQPDYRRNIRAIYYAINSMRMNEKRGIADTIRKAYLQLEAPATERDPYEVLGVRPDTPVDDIKAMYRQKAKRLHPDKGGQQSDEMKELNAAWEQIEEGENRVD